MVRALEAISAQGVTTNRAFLTRLLRHPEYVAGHLHTGFIAEHAAALAEVPNPQAQQVAAIAATLWAHLQRRATDALPSVVSGFRNSRFSDQFAEYGDLRVEYRALGGERFLTRLGGVESTCRLVSFEDPTLTIEFGDGRLLRVRVTEGQGKLWVHSPLGSVTLTENPRFPAPADEANRGGLIAPMPGKVVKVLVKDGDVVKRGQLLMVLEAMKMEQSTTSPEDGTVEHVNVREGDQVTAGQVLLSLQEA
jgi:acetyl/propionyl-CoA carboxylase alpha subunit